LLPLIVVFAKAPRPGFVKTRLGLEPTAAACLYSAFVRQTLTTVCSLCSESELELSLDMTCDAWSEFPIRRTCQSNGDLGIRLYAAFERGLIAGHPNVVILGSDSPTLPVDHIRWLLNCNADVALGPTTDGGYYGVGCRKISSAMFDGVRWSSENALKDTILSVGRCDLSSAVGPGWFDVDTPEDLLAFRQSRFNEAIG
jgi:uncharacterized protein